MELGGIPADLLTPSAEHVCAVRDLNKRTWQPCLSLPPNRVLFKSRRATSQLGGIASSIDIPSM